jgi:hypothetical protein
MGTKQVKMQFQVAANDGESAQVTITAGGTQVFSGSLAQTMNPLVPEGIVEPFSLVEFDLDVANLPVPAGNANSYGQWVTSTDITIAVSGGSVCLQETLANYTFQKVEVTPATNPPTYQMAPGNVSAFSVLRFLDEPVWTPINTDPGRLIFDDNIDTGTGILTIYDNQSVAYTLGMTLYSA